MGISSTFVEVPLIGKQQVWEGMSTQAAEKEKHFESLLR